MDHAAIHTELKRFSEEPCRNMPDAPVGPDGAVHSQIRPLRYGIAIRWLQPSSDVEPLLGDGIRIELFIPC